MNTRTVLVLMGLATLVWLASCARKTEPSDVAHATRDDAVRIVSLSPGITVTLEGLGLGSLIVARHGYDTVAASSLPVAGDQGGLAYETLLRAEPTHVLLQWGSRELPARLVQLADERGWVVESFGSLTWDDVEEMERSLAGMFERALDEQPEMRMAPIGEGERLTAAQAQRVGRVLLLMPGTEPAALGPGSFHYEMAQTQLGCEMAGPLPGPYVRLHAEDFVRLEPEAVVLLKPRAPGEPAGDPFDSSAWRKELGRLAELDVPAIRQGRVAMLDHPHGLLAGSSLADVRASLAEIIGVWAQETGGP